MMKDADDARALQQAYLTEKALADRDALIRELVAALKPFAEEEPEHEAISEDNELVAPRWLDATYGQYRAAREAIAKAKAAGFESMSGYTREDRISSINAHMAAYIRIRRQELSLSFDQLAERAGASKSHVWDLEHQQSKNPTLRLILSLCDALQCSLSSLTGIDVSQPMFSDQEIAMIDAHRRIFQAKAAGYEP